MTTTREPQLRRAACRHGLAVHKSRSRESWAGAAPYMLIDVSTHCLVSDEHCTLDDIEDALKRWTG